MTDTSHLVNTSPSSKRQRRNRKLEMDKEVFLDTLRDSMRAITNGRYFSTERGYQGQLIAELNSRLNISQNFQDNAVWEQEYQKQADKHGITIRPDIILHVPFETGIYNNRRTGNFIVIQLKRRASVRKAKEDFKKLNLMFEKLDYPLGIFINIDSARTFHDCYAGDYSERLYYFAVKLANDEVIIYEQ
jgi:hypothetical protein